MIVEPADCLRVGRQGGGEVKHADDVGLNDGPPPRNKSTLWQ